MLLLYYSVLIVPLFLKISQNSQENICTVVSFLSAASNFINEGTPGQCFPKLLTIFAKSSIVDDRLGFKHASVLPSFLFLLLPFYTTTIDS